MSTTSDYSSRAAACVSAINEKARNAGYSARLMLDEDGAHFQILKGVKSMDTAYKRVPNEAWITYVESITKEVLESHTGKEVEA